MQYEPTLSRDELIALATGAYFGNVDAKNIDAAMDCFNDEALFCIQSAFTRHAGKAAIRRMLEDFTGAYATIVHKDFTCTVDEKNGRITASFEAVLTGHDGDIVDGVVVPDGFPCCCTRPPTRTYHPTWCSRWPSGSVRRS